MPSGNDRTVGWASVRSVEHILVERPTERALTSRIRRRVAHKIRTEEVWTPTVTCWRSGRRDALWRVGGRGTQLRSEGVYCTFLGLSSERLFPRFPLPCCIRVSLWWWHNAQVGLRYWAIFQWYFGFVCGRGFLCHQAVRRDQAALGILHQGACHLSARTRSCQLPPKIYETSLAVRCLVTIVLRCERKGSRCAGHCMCGSIWFPAKRNSCYLDSDASNDPLGMSEH